MGTISMRLDELKKNKPVPGRPKETGLKIAMIAATLIFITIAVINLEFDGFMLPTLLVAVITFLLIHQYLKRVMAPDGQELFLSRSGSDVTCEWTAQADLLAVNDQWVCSGAVSPQTLHDVPENARITLARQENARGSKIVYVDSACI